jgi:hypothetical protein
MVRIVPILAAVLVLMVLVSTARLAFAFSNWQSASLVVGQSNFTDSFFATSVSGLWGPTNVAFDSHGNLWVAD